MDRTFRSVVVCLLLAFSSAVLAVPRYTVTQLPTVNGVSLSPTCLSTSGTVAGTTSDGRTFVYSPSIGTKFIEPPAGYTSITPRAVNESGEVVGYFQNGPYDAGHSFVYRPGNGVVELTAPAGVRNVACGINNHGLVVGYCAERYGYALSTYSATTSGAMTELGVLDGYQEMGTMAINNSGVMLRSSQRYACDGWGNEILEPDVFLSSQGRMDDMNSASEISDFEPGLTHRILSANDINSGGQIVGMLGSYYTEWGDPGIGLGCIGGDGRLTYDPVRAFLYTPGSAPVELGLLPGYGSFSEAMGVNDLGQVVGYSEFESCPLGDASAAFLYCDGQMYELASLLDGNAQGWMLTEARAINNKGQIIAYASRRAGGDWASGTFLLTPVPEPSSLLALLSGFTMMPALLKRKRAA